MKAWSFALFLALSVLCINCSQKNTQQRIYDYEGLFTTLQKHDLDSLYADHETKTTNQFALISTPDFGEDSSIEMYAQHAFERLGVGQKEVNNGILIVISRSKRRVRIATGSGTEKILTDPMVKKIIDSTMIPRFKEDQYYEGIWSGSKAITTFLEMPENKIK